MLKNATIVRLAAAAPPTTMGVVTMGFLILASAPGCDGFGQNPPPTDSGPTTTCGDEIIEGDEVCDGTNVGDIDCAYLNQGSGALTCNTECTGFDISQCSGASGDGDGDGDGNGDGDGDGDGNGDGDGDGDGNGDGDGDGDGNGDGDGDGDGDNIPPGQPQNVTAVALAVDTIQVSWDAVGDADLDHYEVYRGDIVDFDAADAVLVGPMVTATLHVDVGLMPSTTYYYRVRAIDAADNASTPSAPAAEATTLDPPVATDGGFADGGMGPGAPPSLPSVMINPAAPSTGDALSVQFLAPSIDPEGQPVSYTYAWTRGGAAIAGQDLQTLPAAETAKGQLIAVTVTPNDGAQDGPAAMANVTILNTPPTVGVTLGPAGAQQDDDIVANTTPADADGDGVTLGYVWSVNGTPVVNTAATLPAAQTQKGQSISVEVTPDDGDDVGTPVTSAPLVVANTLPTAPTVSIAPATPTVGVEDLVCTGAGSTDADMNDVVTLSYAWQKDGADFATTGTTNAANDTVAAAETAAGGTFTCIVTPNDGDDDGPTGEASATPMGAPVLEAYLASPCTLNVAATTVTAIIGNVIYPATAGAGQGAGIVMEMGFGDDGTDPAVDVSWTFAAATYLGDIDVAMAGDMLGDSYTADLTAPVTGTYDYAYRVSIDGGTTWDYADYGGDVCMGQGNLDGYSTVTTGDLVVP